MSGTRQRFSFRAWPPGLFMGMLLLGGGAAHARPYCDVPDPPPACEGPTTPSPPGSGGAGGGTMSFQRPGISGVSFEYPAKLENLSYSIDIYPAPGDKGKYSRVVIQTSSSQLTGWTTVLDQPVDWAGIWTTGPVTFGKYLSVTAPTPEFCFRGRVMDASGNFSPWTVVKCAGASPVPTDVRVQVGFSFVTVSWKDNSAFDEWYAVGLGSPSDGLYRWSYVQSTPSLRDGMPERTVSIRRPYQQEPVCARVAVKEAPTGFILGSLTNFSDSTPAAPTINVSDKTCVPSPGI